MNFTIRDYHYEGSYAQIDVSEMGSGRKNDLNPNIGFTFFLINW